MTKDEERQLVLLLKKLEPGYYPFEVFLQFARLVVISITEFVPLRKTEDGGVEVLLLKRGADDVFWPNQVHTPGCVVRPGDNDGGFFKPFVRIQSDELKGLEISDPIFVASEFRKIERGYENAQIYWVEVLGEPTVGTFYDAHNLPDHLVQLQKKFIAQAVRSFEASK